MNLRLLWRALAVAWILLSASTRAQGEFTYSTEKGAVKVLMFYAAAEDAIPDTFDGLPVTGMGEYAVSWFPGPTSVTVGKNMLNIDDHAFGSVNDLAEIKVDERNPNYSSRDGVLFDKNQTRLIRFPCGKVGAYSVPASVVRIEADAFRQAYNLTKVRISTNVTMIGDSAFSTCAALTEITVEPGNPRYRSVDGVLFDQNGILLVEYPAGKPGHYSVPGTVTRIGSNAFFESTGLTSLTIPDSVTSMGDWAVAVNGGLTNITIGSGLKSLGVGALTYCGSLTGIQMSASNPFYSSVDGVLFDKSKTTLVRFPGGRMGSYRVPQGVSAIGDQAFFFCFELTGVVLPESVTSIGTSAFESCWRMTNVILPNRLGSIGDRAFSGCGQLASIAIPESVASIGSFSFDDNRQSGLISVDEQNAHYSSMDGVLFDKGKTTLLSFPKSWVGKYAVPSSVSRIADGAFQNCWNLTAVTIPDSVTAIGARTFHNCENLTNAVIGRGVTSIGDDAFANCSSLTSVNIPDGVTRIGEGAFLDCSALSNLTMGSGVTNFGTAAFAGCGRLRSFVLGRDATGLGDSFLFQCDSLAAITVHPQNPSYSSIDGVLFDKGQTTLIQFPGAKPGGYVVPGSVTTILHHAFAGAGDLSSVDIPASVARIEESTFSNCRRLTQVTLRTGLVVLGARAFAHCESLERIDIPIGVTSIGEHTFQNCGRLALASLAGSVNTLGDGAFSGCGSLAKMTLPSGLIQIGSGAFELCTNLTEILVDASNPAYRGTNGMVFDKSLTSLVVFPAGKVGSQSISEGVLSIGKSAFAGCPGLTSVTIPGTVTRLGDRAFFGCAALRDIAMTQGLLSIGSEAFASCSNLVVLRVPNSVNSMGARVAEYCTSLTKASIGSGLKSIGIGAFEDCVQLSEVIVGGGVRLVNKSAFKYCRVLSGFYFSGNAPETVAGALAYTEQATIYHLPGTTGWGQEFAGRPTALWALPNPVMVNSKAGLEGGAGQFSFTISWATNATVVVEASPDAANPVWSPVAIKTLVDGWYQFNDPGWLDQPSGFYRVRQR